MAYSGMSAEYIQRIGSVRRHIAAGCQASEAGRRADILLGRVERRLAKPARLVLLGEVNGGKTTLANRLLGCELLSTDVVHNTRTPLLLKYAGSPGVHVAHADGTRRALSPGALHLQPAGEGDRVEVGLPVDLLRQLEIVDTPGAVFDETCIRSIRSVARTADIAVWCTIATQAWRGTEAALWRALGARKGRAGILAVTHADLLGEADRARVLARVEREAGHLFAAIVMVAPNDAAGPGPDILRATVERIAAEVEGERCRRAGEVVGRFARRLASLEDGVAAGRSEPVLPPIPAYVGALAEAAAQVATAKGGPGLVQGVAA